MWSLSQSTSATGNATPTQPRQAKARSPRNVSVRLPQDNVARILLLNSDLWHALGGGEHEFLSCLLTWHGELFRWLERELTEHGHREWPELRSQLADQSFVDSACQLARGWRRYSRQPELEDLRVAVSQAHAAVTNRDAMKLLGRA